MAGDWIKMRVDLSDDPAVITIASTHDIDEDYVVGKLHKLWSWADRHATDGKAQGITPKWVDKYISQPGIADSLVGVGWLSFTGDHIIFPNFDRHNGKSAKQRVEAATRKRKSRINKGINDNGSEMSQEKCDKSVTREEKRREEKNNKNTEVKSCASHNPPSQDDSEFKLEHPTPKAASCPFLDIVKLYHDTCPSLPRILKDIPSRRNATKAIWITFGRDIESFRDVFEAVERSEFLTGRKPSKAHPNFKADFDWIMKTANFTKIYEGKYENQY